MPVEFLSAADRDKLARFPSSVDPEDLGCFVLTPQDLDYIARRYGRGARVAGGLQIGAMRLVGFAPDDLTDAPPAVVGFVAEQVDGSPGDLATYSTRPHTTSDHVSAVIAHLGFTRADPGALKALGDWLLTQALEHDRPMVLLRLACERLPSTRVVRPRITTIERLVATARVRAADETWKRLAPHLGQTDRLALDELLDVGANRGVASIVWLGQTAAAALPATIRTQLDKLEHLRRIGIGPERVADLNPNRVRHLAAQGRRMTPQALRRADPTKRYPILVAALAELRFSLTDEILELYDGALGSTDRRARTQLDEVTRSTASAANDTVRLFQRIGAVN